MTKAQRSITMFKSVYPKANEEWILNQIKEFNKVFIVGGIIIEKSSHYSRYLRGWLMSRYMLAENAVIKEVTDKVSEDDCDNINEVKALNELKRLVI